MLTDPNEDFLIFGAARHGTLLLLDRADNSGFIISCQRCGLVGHRAYQSRDVALIYAKVLSSSSVDLSDCQEVRLFAVNLVEIIASQAPARLVAGQRVTRWWKVKLAVSYAGRSRTFWRWYESPNKETPTVDQILAWFWENLFTELHGFAFEDVPSP